MSKADGSKTTLLYSHLKICRLARTEDGDVGGAAMGRRLWLWWPGEGAFFGGAITATAVEDGAVAIAYDDGEVQGRLWLSDRLFHWEPPAVKEEMAT